MRKHRPKHVQLTWNNKLIYIVHLVGYLHNCALAVSHCIGICMHVSYYVGMSQGSLFVWHRYRQTELKLWGVLHGVIGKLVMY